METEVTVLETEMEVRDGHEIERQAWRFFRSNYKTARPTKQQQLQQKKLTRTTKVNHCEGQRELKKNFEEKGRSCIGELSWLQVHLISLFE